MQKERRARVKISCTLIFLPRKESDEMARKYRRLRYEDRRKIEQMCKMGKSVLDMAEALGVHRDTIYKEFARNHTTKELYNAERAQKTI